jgi:uncharacterized protein (TIGR02757 family)
VNAEQLKDYLDQQVRVYNQISFIDNDPISIPHRYTRLQDIEISAFWTAMLSWGQRKTIINKATALFALMDDSPYDFITGHSDADLKPFLQFKHRTFQADDTFYFIRWFKDYYQTHESLEQAFILDQPNTSIHASLAKFHERFFDHPLALQRTRKHVSTPIRRSSCKRLNMFLRWMVRKDEQGVDFGLWSSIDPSTLMIPLDVHVFNVARSLGLLTRDKADWQAVEELTEVLRGWNPDDPVIYDYALFSIGLEGRKST